jgi:hypothetical protein
MKMVGIRNMNTSFLLKISVATTPFYNTVSMHLTAAKMLYTCSCDDQTESLF